MSIYLTLTCFLFQNKESLLKSLQKSIALTLFIFIALSSGSSHAGFRRGNGIDHALIILQENLKELDNRLKMLTEANVPYLNISKKNKDWLLLKRSQQGSHLSILLQVLAEEAPLDWEIGNDPCLDQDRPRVACFIEETKKNNALIYFQHQFIEGPEFSKRRLQIAILHEIGHYIDRSPNEKFHTFLTQFAEELLNENAIPVTVSSTLIPENLMHPFGGQWLAACALTFDKEKNITREINSHEQQKVADLRASKICRQYGFLNFSHYTVEKIQKSSDISLFVLDNDLKHKASNYCQGAVITFKELYCHY
jgi:hypothetical protein